MDNKEIMKRVAWLIDKPQGILYDRKSQLHRIVITKEEKLIRMFFTTTGVSEIPKLSGCMCEYDLRNPLNLIIAYTQAQLLPILWRNDPDSVYVIGFAGGRDPLVLHQYWPEVRVESTDIDADLKKLAQRFFAIEFDNRQILTIQDGRDYLSNLSNKKKYDFIIVDAFRGTGFGPFHLATVEFYDLCKKHLKPYGSVVTNLVSSDSIFIEKINTMKACFENVYVHYDPSFIETYVVLGTDGQLLDKAQRIERASRIQERCKFEFPFLKRAKDLRPLKEQRKHLAKFGKTQGILIDKNIPDVIMNIPKNDALFYNVGRNEVCPCGSGRKFKKCHGR